jgi:hypothetical protein
VALRRPWQGDILRACLSDPSGESARTIVRAAPKAELELLPALASFHRVVAPVYDSVRSVVPADVLVQLERLYRDDLARRLIASANLRQSRELLDSLDVPFLVVKGPVLSEAIYDRPRARFYRDLDLVVPHESFAVALTAFEQEGAAVVDANWPYFLEHVAGQVDLSTNVDLHWHFLFFESLRRETNLRMEEVFERSRTVTVDGVSVRTPDRADTLIHLALHACLEGGKRLVWLKDIEQVVVNDRPPWSEVVERSLTSRVNLLVGTMLMRSRAALATPVPDDVIRALVPNGGWRAFLRSLDRVFPITARRREDTPATLAAKVTRADVKQTLGFVAGTLARRTRRRRQPESDLSDSSARDAYLDRVVGGR